MSGMTYRNFVLGGPFLFLFLDFCFCSTRSEKEVHFWIVAEDPARFDSHLLCKNKTAEIECVWCTGALVHWCMARASVFLHRFLLQFCGERGQAFWCAKRAEKTRWHSPEKEA